VTTPDEILNPGTPDTNPGYSPVVGTETEPETPEVPEPDPTPEPAPLAADTSAGPADDADASPTTPQGPEPGLFHQYQVTHRVSDRPDSVSWSQYTSEWLSRDDAYGFVHYHTFQ